MEVQTFSAYLAWRSKEPDAKLPVESNTRWYREQYHKYLDGVKEEAKARPKPRSGPRKSRVTRLNLLSMALDREEKTVEIEKKMIEALKKRTQRTVNTTFDLETETVLHNMISGCLFDFAAWLSNYQEEFATTRTDRFKVAIEDFARERKLSVKDPRTKTWANYLIPDLDYDTEEYKEDDIFDLEIAKNNIKKGGK
jgi:hypothetical protein